jgi:membrane fusion protein, multidrug efflux system
MTACSRDQRLENVSPGVIVNTLVIEPKTIPAVFEYVGFAQSSHPVEIRARIEGYLDEISYTEGAFVKKGQRMFQLDPKPLEAALDNAKGILAQQEALLWNATRSFDRLQPLYEQKAASRRDLDDALSQKLAAAAAVQSAKAKIQEAELSLGYTSIHAPVDGLADESNYREGALINPGQTSLLTTVSVIDPIWINFSVSEGEVLKSGEEVNKKQLEMPKDMNFEVEVILANDFTFPLKGRVSFSSPTIDPKTGTMSVRAVLPNPAGVIKPGQFLRVRILGAVRPDAILVPQRAVLESAKGTFVYIVGDGGKVEIRFVTAGDWYGNDWIITSGLKQGDQVIIDGVNKVHPGSLVEVGT